MERGQEGAAPISLIPPCSVSILPDGTAAASPLPCWVFSVCGLKTPLGPGAAHLTPNSLTEHPFPRERPRISSSDEVAPSHLWLIAVMSAPPHPHLTVINDPQLPGPPC